jgi:hypothetical protein
MEFNFRWIEGYGKNMLALPFAGTPSFFRTNLVDALRGSHGANWLRYLAAKCQAGVVPTLRKTTT